MFTNLITRTLTIVFYMSITWFVALPTEVSPQLPHPSGVSGGVLLYSLVWNSRAYCFGFPSTEITILLPSQPG